MEWVCCSIPNPPPTSTSLDSIKIGPVVRDRPFLFLAERAPELQGEVQRYPLQFGSSIQPLGQFVAALLNLLLPLPLSLYATSSPCCPLQLGAYAVASSACKHKLWILCAQVSWLDALPFLLLFSFCLISPFALDDNQTRLLYVVGELSLGSLQCIGHIHLCVALQLESLVF